MYLGLRETLAWVDAVTAGLRSESSDRTVDLVVFPTFVALAGCRDLLVGSPVDLGAQNICWADSGAFTGEVSPRDVVEVGCRWAEVGHAERRRYFGEDDDTVLAKVAAAARNGLTPLICIGEPERQTPVAAARACRAFVLRAAEIAVDNGCTSPVFAYEPVWAIGAEQPAEPDYVAEVVRTLRDECHKAAPAARFVYGGSAGPGLYTQLHGSIEGLFLGRFAHDPTAFLAVRREIAEIVRAAVSSGEGQEGTT